MMPANGLGIFRPVKIPKVFSINVLFLRLRRETIALKEAS
jgi:hypothetical protein